MPTEPSRQFDSPPTFWQNACWPIIICLLLGGHAAIMLVAMSLSQAGPPLDIPEDYSKATLELPSPEVVALPSDDKR